MCYIHWRVAVSFLAKWKCWKREMIFGFICFRIHLVAICLLCGQTFVLVNTAWKTKNFYLCWCLLWATTGCLYGVSACVRSAELFVSDESWVRKAMWIWTLTKKILCVIVKLTILTIFVSFKWCEFFRSCCFQ